MFWGLLALVQIPGQGCETFTLLALQALAEEASLAAATQVFTNTISKLHLSFASGPEQVISADSKVTTPVPLKWINS